MDINISVAHGMELGEQAYQSLGEPEDGEPLPNFDQLCIVRQNTGDDARYVLTGVDAHFKLMDGGLESFPFPDLEQIRQLAKEFCLRSGIDPGEFKIFTCLDPD